MTSRDIFFGIVGVLITLAGVLMIFAVFATGGDGYSRNQYETWVEACSEVAASLPDATQEGRQLALYNCVDGFIAGRGR